MDRGGEEEGEGGMNGESSMETYPFSRDLPNPGIEPRPPTLQADSLPAEPQGKPKNTGVSSLSLLQQIFWPRNWTRVSCITGRFFTNWAMREAPTYMLLFVK